MRNRISVIVPPASTESSFQYPEILKKSKTIVSLYCICGMLPLSLRQHLANDSLKLSDRNLKLWKKWDILYVSFLVVLNLAVNVVVFQSFIPILQNTLMKRGFDADALTMIILAVGIYITNSAIWISWWPRTSEFLHLWNHIQVHVALKYLVSLLLYCWLNPQS